MFRCDAVTQVYLDDELLMYLPAYGDDSCQIGFRVDHGDIIVKDLRIWALGVEDLKGFSIESNLNAVLNGVAY